MNELRKKIDNVDRQIIKLLSERQSIVKKIAKIKKENNLPIINKEREEEVIRKAKGMNKINPVFVENLFNLIIKESRRVQK